MNFKTKLAVLAIGAAMGSMAFNASACSTVIVGKDASATGNILVGHNEDNGGRILTAQHWVPAATHKAGEMIKFEEAAASIPQVEKTFGFFWSQTFDPTGAPSPTASSMKTASRSSRMPARAFTRTTSCRPRMAASATASAA